MLSFFPRDVLVESVSEGFPSYSWLFYVLFVTMSDKLFLMVTAIVFPHGFLGGIKD